MILNLLKHCRFCIQDKQSVRLFPKVSKYKSTDLLNLIHSDLCGSMSVPSRKSIQYFVIFIYDKLCYTKNNFLKIKYEVKNAFMRSLAN